MDHVPGKVNRKALFWFDGRLIRSKCWSKLSHPAKAVYPVIMAHVNREGIAFPSEKTIAEFSGVTEKTVRRATDELSHSLPSFDIERYCTSRGHLAKQYRPRRLPYTPTRTFPFYRCIIKTKTWARLRRASRSLYPVMRCFGFFDAKTYAVDVPGACLPKSEFMALYKKREHDYCNADPSILAEHAGLSRRSLWPAFRDLERHGLLEDMGRLNGTRTRRLYLRPR